MEEEIGWENEVTILDNEILYIPPNSSSWYVDMKHFLHNESSPNHLNCKGRRALRL